MAQLIDNNGAFDLKIRLRTRGSWVRILPGAPVINEAGHFAQLSFLHEADGVRYPPVTAADDQFVSVEFDFVDEQSQVRFAEARRADR